MNGIAVTIVLIEDDPGHARLIEKNVRRAGVHNPIVSFADGTSALAYLSGANGNGRRTANSALLVLLDLNLPDMSGLDILARIKADNHLKRAPVVVLTTTDDKLEIRHRYDLGCNVYITKPVEYEGFTSAIRQLGLFLNRHAGARDRVMPQSQVRVLYIDDDPGIGRLVQRHLERVGFIVRLTANGDAGLAIAKAEPFDAIALDHYMPGRDGLEVLGDLLACSNDTPRDLCNRGGRAPDRGRGIEGGASDYVVKDVQGAFIDLLVNAIRQSRHEVDLRRAKEAAERELRRSRDQLEQLVAQQVVLLREVNHRVANSLQLIGSLIELQSRRMDDADAREVLRHAATRVEAVSLVHRRLYTSDDVKFVQMDQYLAGLVDDLSRAVAAEASGHRIELRAEPIRVPTAKAVSIGLIVNELVTNAIKYAYPHGSSGDVRVDLRSVADVVTLTVEDDGQGYPDSAAEPQGSGLGAVIVSAMANSICGSVTLDRAHRGTRFVVRLAA